MSRAGGRTWKGYPRYVEQWVPYFSIAETIALLACTNCWHTSTADSACKACIVKAIRDGTDSGYLR